MATQSSVTGKWQSEHVNNVNSKFQGEHETEKGRTQKQQLLHLVRSLNSPNSAPFPAVLFFYWSEGLSLARQGTWRGETMCQPDTPWRTSFLPTTMEDQNLCKWGSAVFKKKKKKKSINVMDSSGINSNFTSLFNQTVLI